MNDFEALGAQFRQAREARELSLPDVEKQTRIRLKYLQAIEYGQFHLIDTPIQLQGFLRTYAKTVGIDPDFAVSRFEEIQRNQRRRGFRNQKQSAPAPYQPASNAPYRPQAAPAPIVNGRDPDPELYSTGPRATFRPLMVILLALLLTAAIVGGTVLTLNSLTSETATPDPGAGIEVLDPASIATVPPSPTPTNLPLPTPFSTPVINAGAGLYISVVVEQRLWLQVVTDNNVAFEGVLRPGDAAGYSATETITIRTSNAAGLRLLINNQPFSLGTGREAAERTFTAGADIPTQTPAPSASPTISLTPTQTVTAMATITATITNTASLEAQTSPNPATFLFTATSQFPTAFPTFGFSSSTPTATVSPLPPTTAPTLTASPFLPPRATRTPGRPK